jgi:DNA invertase Pin-like site-specific DNA recombinase
MILECVQSAGAVFRSMTGAVDTAIPAGRMMMQMLGAFAEFERAMIRERTCSGLASARAKGRAGGHRPKLTADQRQEAMQMIGSSQKAAADVARLFKVHPAAVSRLLAQSTVARPGSRRTRAAGV